MDSQDAVVAMVLSSLFAGTLGAARRMASRTHDAGDPVGAARRTDPGAPSHGATRCPQAGGPGMPVGMRQGAR